jgi:hypothetical protein
MQGIVSQEIGISQVSAVLVFTKLTLMALLGRSCPISQAVTRRSTVSQPCRPLCCAERLSIYVHEICWISQSDKIRRMTEILHVD